MEMFRQLFLLDMFMHSELKNKLGDNRAYRVSNISFWWILAQFHSNWSKVNGIITKNLAN